MFAYIFATVSNDNVIMPPDGGHSGKRGFVVSWFLCFLMCNRNLCLPVVSDRPNVREGPNL